MAPSAAVCEAEDRARKLRRQCLSRAVPAAQLGCFKKPYAVRARAALAAVMRKRAGAAHRQQSGAVDLTVKVIAVQCLLKQNLLLQHACCIQLSGHSLCFLHRRLQLLVLEVLAHLFRAHALPLHGHLPVDDTRRQRQQRRQSNWCHCQLLQR